MREMQKFFQKNFAGLNVLEWYLLFAVLVCAILWLFARFSPPEYAELLTASGQCRVPESRTVYDLYVENNGEVSGPYQLDDRIVPNAGQIIRDIEQGTQVELLYIDGEDCTVMELTVNGEEWVSYDRALAMWYKNTSGVMGTALLTVVVVVVMLGGMVAVVYWKNRRKAAQERVTAEDAAREELRLYAKIRYSADEQGALEAYVTDAFGPVGRVYYELDAEVPHIDLVVCEPCKRRPLYTVTTLGLGAFRLGVPEELEERNQSFVELTMLLPKDWDFAEDGWPLTVLKSLARRLIVERDDAPLKGDAYYLSEEERETSGFAAVMAIPASVREGNNPRVMIPGGKIVNFYLLVPIYEEEWNYIFARGSSFALWKRMAAHGLGAFVQPERESSVDPDTWLDEDLEPFYFGENAARGEYYLGLSDLTYLADCFADCGLAPSGLCWERVARECLRETAWRDRDEIEFSSSEEMLFIESGNETLLRRFALRLRDLCEDEAAFMELLERSKEDNDGT